MADKLNKITVRGAGDNRKIVLWERHEDHPNGEIVVSNDGETVEVAETAQVKRLVAEGTLVKSSGTSASRSQATPDSTESKSKGDKPA